jgi:hypothetical protein
MIGCYFILRAASQVKNVDSVTFYCILLSLLPFEKQPQGVVRGGGGGGGGGGVGVGGGGGGLLGGGR